MKEIPRPGGPEKEDDGFRIVSVEDAPPPAAVPPVPWKLAAAAAAGMAVLAALAAALLFGGSKKEPPAAPPAAVRREEPAPPPKRAPAPPPPVVVIRPPAPPEEPAPLAVFRPAPEEPEPAAPPPAEPPKAEAPAPAPEPAADPLKEFDDALAGGRLDEAAKFLAKIPDADARNPRERLEAARTAQAVRDLFASGKEAALARVREAQEDLKKAAREDSERDARVSKAMAEFTERNPLRVRLSETLVLEPVRVTGYADGRVRMSWPQGQVEYPLDLLPEDAKATLLSVALSRAAARDHFEFGKLFLASQDFDRAARCFASAGRLDPALKPLCPDVERIRACGRLFEGSYKATGNILGLRWAFSSESQAKDFVALSGRFAVRPGRGLEISGDKLGLAAVRDIPFRERVRVSALARETEGSAHLLGIRFAKPEGGEVMIYGAMATSLKAFLVVRVEDGRSENILPPTPGAAGHRMAIDFIRGRFVFKIGERAVWSGNEGGFSDVTVFVGGAALARPGTPPGRAEVLFRDVTVSGGVNPEWMRKKTAGFRDAMAAELSREYRLKEGEGAAAALALSVDPAVKPPDAGAWKAALEKVRLLYEKPEEAQLKEARAALEKAAKDWPGFAPAWYFRGLVEEGAGDARQAARHYDEALALLPDFPEALCARAVLSAVEADWEAVRRRAGRALELKPDLGMARLLRGRILLEEGQPLSALEESRLARRLAPLDAALQARAGMLAHAARGPAWARTNEHRTAHYLVRSDLPAAKCRAYAEHLEAVRPHYQEALGRAAPEGAKPAIVLLFDSQEGYHSYMDFTAGDRQENSLGAYSPWYGQLALFEDAEAEETLRVLAHEGFHQYLHRLIPHAPIWFEEGMAEYVAACRVENGKVVRSGGILEDRLGNLKAALKYGWVPRPFREIMVETPAEFCGKAAPLRYAQAWSMIHFFMQAEGGRWRPKLAEYMDRLAAGEGAREAMVSVFGKGDLKELEEAWMKHHGLPAPRARPGDAAAAAGGGAPPAAGAGAVDILKALGAPKAMGMGWYYDGKVLRSSSGMPRRVTIVNLPVRPPEEYDLSIKVSRLSGNDGLRVGLCGGGRSFVAVVDWFREDGTVLERLDGRPFQLPAGPPRWREGYRDPATLVFQVRRSGVRAEVDGSTLLNWRGEFSRLSPPEYAIGSAGPGLFLGNCVSEFLVFKLELVPVNPPAAGAGAAEAGGAGAGAAEAKAPGAGAPEAKAPSMRELREQLASRDPGTRLGAVGVLRDLRGREARSMLAERLGSDPDPAVRAAAARAMARHKHPAAAEALEAALRGSIRDTKMAEEIIASLGELDMCACLKALTWALEAERGAYFRSALAQIRRIGCGEAIAPMAALLKRAEAEERKPDFFGGVGNLYSTYNPNKDVVLARMAEPLRQALREMAGKEPSPGETWWQFVSRGGHSRKVDSLYYCEETDKTFVVPSGKSPACPYAEPGKGKSHEDVFLKHQ